MGFHASVCSSARIPSQLLTTTSDFVTHIVSKSQLHFLFVIELILFALASGEYFRKGNKHD